VWLQWICDVVSFGSARRAVGPWDDIRLRHDDIDRLEATQVEQRSASKMGMGLFSRSLRRS